LIAKDAAKRVYDKIPFFRKYRKYGLLNGQVLLKPPVLVPSKKV